MLHARLAFALLPFVAFTFLQPLPASGQESQALVLDGDTSYAEAADSDELDIDGEALTVEAWVKHDGGGDQRATIVEKGGFLTDEGYGLALSGEGEEVPVEAFVGTEGGLLELTSEEGVPSGRWTHVAAVYDGTELSLYLNGEREASTAEASGSVGTNNDPLRIGASSLSEEDFFSGRIDEVRVWRAVRSVSQIREHRFEELTGSQSGLAAYYSFPAGAPTGDQGGVENDNLTFSGDAETGAPDALPVPPDLFVEDEGPGEVRLRWEERTGPNGENAAEEFAVYRSPPSGLGNRTQIQTVSAPETTHTATGLTNGETSFFEVTSVNAEEQESDHSSFAVGTPHAGDEADPMRGGAALALSGDGAYGEVSDRPSLDIGGDSLTIEAWVKHDGGGNQRATIVEKGGFLTDEGYGLALSGEGEEVPVEAFVGTAGGQLDLTSEEGVPSGRWTHVAAVYDGTELSLYLNGEREASTAEASGSVGTNTDPLRIGASSLSEEDFFSGRIDEVRVWDVARSTADIQANYQKELVGSEENLRGYFRLSETAGTATSNASGPWPMKVQLAGDADFAPGPAVEPANEVPVARADSFGTMEGQTLTVAAPGVLENDDDPDGDSLTAALVDSTSNGSVTLQSNGALEYAPNESFTGGDSLRYAATDSLGAADTARVEITVTPVGGAPTISAIPDTTIDEDTSTGPIPFTVDDPEMAPADLTVTGSSGNPDLVPNDSITFPQKQGGQRYVQVTPRPDSNGTAPITLVVENDDGRTDTTVFSVTVEPINDAPVARADSFGTQEGQTLTVAAPGVLENDRDADDDSLTASVVSGASNGTLTVEANGSFEYAPDAGFSGTDRFDYETTDPGGKGDTTTATIQVQRSSSVAVLPEVSFPIVVSTDAGEAQGLTLGIDAAATTGIDNAFEEKERPPLPPSGVFDARLIGQDTPAAGQLGQGVVVDVRPGPAGFTGQKKHRIAVQPGTADSLTFTWTLPEGISGTIEDVFGGAVFGPVSMEGRDSITVEAGAPDAIVTIDYSGGQGQVNVQTASVRQDSLVTFVNTGVALGFTGVSGSGALTVRRLGNGPSSTAGISESNVSEYRHIIEPESAFRFEEAKVRLAVEALPGIGDPGAVTLYKRSQEGSGSFSALATTVLDGGTPGDISDDTLLAKTGSFSEFVLASNSEPLPVEMASFEARVTGEEGAMLTWRTASETNNAGYEVQHRPPGSEDWARLGFVESKAAGGTTTETKAYRFAAEGLSPGTHDFRLRQVDLDGRSTLTDPVSVQLKMEEVLRLTAPSPNPVSKRATLSFAVKEKTKATITVYNVLGEKVRTLYDGTPTAGESRRLQVDVSGLSSGIYFIRLSAEDTTRTQKLTVVR